MAALPDDFQFSTKPYGGERLPTGVLNFATANSREGE
jgi:hypothetical protein